MELPDSKDEEGNPVRGMVQNLEEDNAGIVLFGGAKSVKEGDKVQRTREIASVPVGDGLYLAALLTRLDGP
jgi:F-type H+/Na+-transporting ATPase subunit alpha